MTTSEGLSAGQVLELLGALGQRLEQRDLTAEIYVAGGAAMLLRYGRRSLTRDVDVAAVSPAVAEEARRLAAERGLDAHWLSAGMAAWAPPSDATDEVRRMGGLEVRIAGPGPMLAMKLAAARGRDVEDVRRLCAVLGIASADEAVRVAVEVYGEDSVVLGDVEDSRTFVTGILDAADVGPPLPDATEHLASRCGRIVPSSGLPCRLTRGHAGRCRSRATAR